jgi:hypothetical protein
MDKDLVARNEPRLGGTDRADHAGGLHPECHRWRRADLPCAGPDEVVPVADPGGSDLDQHFVAGGVGWNGKLQLLDPPPECMDPGRSHFSIVAAMRNALDQ